MAGVAIAHYRSSPLSAVFPSIRRPIYVVLWEQPPEDDKREDAGNATTAQESPDMNEEEKGDSLCLENQARGA